MLTAGAAPVAGPGGGYSGCTEEAAATAEPVT
jgi:hypothetical protein